VPDTALYGPTQSRFARLLERREERHPDEAARELRGRLLSGLRGRVIEIGCGDGRAFEHYPPEVESVLAVEPHPVARAAAEERAAAAPVPIEVVAGFAERLSADDDAFDAAVAIWVLCSVPHPDAALREIRRVLAAGGALWVYEHVRSPHVAFRAVQHATDSLFWTRSLGGCRTTRDTEHAIRAAGFEFDRIERGFQSSSLLTITAAPYILGVARQPPRGRVVRLATSGSDPVVASYSCADRNSRNIGM
jgi:ubiquinone/menaquinone biosynthesis C-methylase UbiE